MDDAAVMCVPDGVCDLEPVAEELLDWEPITRNDLVERLAFDMLHHDENAALLLADVVDRTDVGVAENGRRERLLEEPGARVHVLCRANELDSGEAAEARVARTVDLTHPASSDQSRNLVRTESGAWSECHN
jgi:hypothetical protein